MKINMKTLEKISLNFPYQNQVTWKVSRKSEKK